MQSILEKFVRQIDNFSIRKKMIFAAAMNFRAEGGGGPMAPGADAQDGKLVISRI